MTAHRIEGALLVAILLIVGGMAGAASFTHVHDWTMYNSPPGTGGWFGWANAAISELIPIAALLTIRRRRRTGGSIRYPMTLLICAVALSLAAQLAVAVPTPAGWLLSAVPALAFLGLSKLVLTVPPAPSPSPEPSSSSSEPVPVPSSVPVPPSSPSPSSSSSSSSSEPVPPSPVLPASVGDEHRAGAVRAAAGDRADESSPTTARPEPMVSGNGAGPTNQPPAGDTGQPSSNGNGRTVGVDLVQLARQHAATHQAATGRPITRDELRAQLRVATGTASDLLRAIRDGDRNGLVPVPATAFPTRTRPPALAAARPAPATPAAPPAQPAVTVPPAREVTTP